jgi:hypothetical protein
VENCVWGWLSKKLINNHSFLIIYMACPEPVEGSAVEGVEPISEAKKMLFRLTINPRPNSLGYFGREINAPNPYDRPEKTVTINAVFSPLIFWFYGGYFVYFNWLVLCVCYRTFVLKNGYMEAKRRSRR